MNSVAAAEVGAARPSPASARELWFRHGARGRDLLRGLSLELRAGELVALVGPNGAGKSTLLHLLGGYLAPTRGRALLGGDDSHALPRPEVARRLSLVPQRADGTFPFTALEMTLMGRQARLAGGLNAPWGLDSAEDVDAAREALARVGAADLAERALGELSGGERQLALIARALAQDAPVMLLDEPTASLDLRRQWEVMGLLARLSGRGGDSGAGEVGTGKAILATLHDLNLASQWADRIALLSDGMIVACGAPAEVLREGVLREAYGLPLRVQALPGGRPRVELPGRPTATGPGSPPGAGR